MPFLPYCNHRSVEVDSTILNVVPLLVWYPSMYVYDTFDVPSALNPNNGDAPLISNLNLGFVVPIPTFPLDIILILSVRLDEVLK